MLAYINDDVVDAHVHINHSGSDLLQGHRDYIQELEGYLRANGASAFVPLPKWDPATAIPSEFNVVKPTDGGTELPPLEDLNPSLPLPRTFSSPSVCSFPSAAVLGNSLNGWHGEVHVQIGGTMGDARIASAAPIFWCWHAFIDDVYATWQACPSRSRGLDDLPMTKDVFDPSKLPSGKVSRKLFKEWADWGKENLRLE